jgi:hypothetical protein
MEAKQARTEGEKKNLEIGILNEQIFKIRKQHEAELQEQHKIRMEESKQRGIAES